MDHSRDEQAPVESQEETAIMLGSGVDDGYSEEHVQLDRNDSDKPDGPDLSQAPPDVGESDDSEVGYDDPSEFSSWAIA